MATDDPSRRRQYVPAADVLRVIEAAPNAYWRLMIALARFAGLRCPSDVLSLTWDAVNFADGRIVVTSPKVQHHAGGGKRVIPITEDFKQYLEDVWELSGTDTHVFPEFYKRTQGKHGMRGANFGTQFEKIIIRAGVVPWEKLWQNLRSSYETDLAKYLPLAVAAKITGNTMMVAMRHYVDVTDETFETAKAIRLTEPKAERSHKSSLQNALLSVQEMGRNGKNNTNAESVKSLEIPAFATPCRPSQKPPIHPSGLEPLTFGSVDRCSIQLS